MQIGDRCPGDNPHPLGWGTVGEPRDIVHAYNFSEKPMQIGDRCPGGNPQPLGWYFHQFTSDLMYTSIYMPRLRGAVGELRVCGISSSPICEYSERSKDNLDQCEDLHQQTTLSWGCLLRVSARVIVYIGLVSGFRVVSLCCEVCALLNRVCDVRPRIYILQRVVQWKQGVVIYMMLYTSLLYNATPIHCTPLRLHPPLVNAQKSCRCTRCELPTLTAFKPRNALYSQFS